MNKQDQEVLTTLYINLFGEEPSVAAITGGGSPREYVRLKSGRAEAVGVTADDVNENETFIQLARKFEKAGVRTPRVLSVSPDKRHYLLEDLGDTALFDLLKEPNRIELAKKALDDLLEIQMLPEDLWKDAVGFKPFSKRLVHWDLNYFKYDFLKPYGASFDEEALEDDFDHLSKALTDPKIIRGLMYRDFQSRNIMVSKGEFHYIDFQGAREGPMVYDAVSFIWQAKAPFTFEEREMLCDYYAGILSTRTGENKEVLQKQLEIFEVFRTLQVLGAYGFRGLIERKPHFLQSLPNGIANLLYLLDKGALKDFPELRKVAKALREKNVEKEGQEGGQLTLKVFSFSYKKGYPEDRSGNGGGFMFDCRGIHNPGRYEEYKTLTGRHQKVIEFLEQTPEASDFVGRAIKLVEPSVARYISRGFTSLQVGFGCTGGQHRSVYCAEKFAQAMKERFPQIKVELIHREQNIQTAL